MLRFELRRVAFKAVRWLRRWRLRVRVLMHMSAWHWEPTSHAFVCARCSVSVSLTSTPFSSEDACLRCSIACESGFRLILYSLGDVAFAATRVLFCGGMVAAAMVARCCLVGLFRRDGLHGRICVHQRALRFLSYVDPDVAMTQKKYIYIST